MYEQIREEYKKPLTDIGVNFDIEYNNAYNKYGYKPELIRGVLQAILDEYYNTPHTTKGGKFGRFLARIASFILPFINIKK